MHTTTNAVALAFANEIKAASHSAPCGPGASRIARTSIEQRVRRHEAALALAKQHQLAAARRPGCAVDVSVIDELLAQRDTEVIDVRTAMCWAALDALDFHCITDQTEREEAAGYWMATACARSERYETALHAEAPDVAAYVRAANKVRFDGRLATRSGKIAYATEILSECEAQADAAARIYDVQRLTTLAARINRLAELATGEILEHANALQLKLSRLLDDLQVARVGAVASQGVALPAPVDYDRGLVERAASGAEFAQHLLLAA